MDGFDKWMRDQWEKRHELDFQEADWDQIQAKLHTRSVRRFPGLLLLLIPWLGIGGLLILLYNHHHQIKDLQSELLSFRMVKDTLVQVSALITHDTVHVYHKITSRDTLFIQTGLAQIDGPTRGVDNWTRLGGDASSRLNLERSWFDLISHNESPSLRNRFTPKTLEDIRIFSTLPSNSRPPVPGIPRNQASLPVTPMDVYHEPKVPFLRKTASQLRPHGMSIGLKGYGLLPVGKGISQSAGFGVGFQMAFLYGRQWQLGLCASVNQISFEIERFNAILGVPEVAPPNESFDFIAAEVLRPYVTLDLDGCYTLYDERRLSPFFEAGLRLAIPQPYDVLYDFKSEATGVTWTYENSPKEYGALPIQAIFGAGLRYRLGHSWVIGGVGNYMHGLSQGAVIPNAFQVGGILRYQF